MPTTRLMPTLTPSSKLSGLENTFSLDIIDGFNDDSVIVEARQLTVSPFLDGRDVTVEDDVTGDESDVTDSNNLLNVTASLYSGFSLNAVTDPQVSTGATTAAENLNVPQQDETSPAAPYSSPDPAPFKSQLTTVAPTTTGVPGRAQPTESGNTITGSDDRSEGGANGALQTGADSDGDTTAASTASVFSPATTITTSSINDNTEGKSTTIPSMKDDSNTDLAQKTTDDGHSQKSVTDATVTSGGTTLAQSESTVPSSSATPSAAEVTVPEQNATTTTTAATRATTSVANSTLMVGSSGNSSGLAFPSDTSSAEDDTFWPIVAALVIGIPSIIVFGIAITVIHKRRLASPARLRAASMYPSL